MLEVVNQLLNQEGVVTVVAADMPAVAASADLKYQSLAQFYAPTGSNASGNASGDFGRTFLQKIIQLQFDIPAHSTTKIRGLVEALASQIDQPPKTATNTIRAKIEIWRKRETQRLFNRGAMSGLQPSPRNIRLALLGVLSFFIPYSIILIIMVSWGALYRGVLFVTLLCAPYLYLTLRAFGVYMKFIRNMLTRKARRLIDDKIRQSVGDGERDFKKVEDQIASSLINGTSGVTNELIRERVQAYIEDESELQREAEDEVMNYLQPLPRHAKRLLNRLRLLLFVAHERRMFGGAPELTARHIGKWAVLCERWPELAQALIDHPGATAELEGRPGNESPQKDKYHRTLQSLVPAYTDDPELQAFFHSGTELTKIIERLIHFEPAT